ncbi:hypothetical protein IIB50_00385 [Patescibacteria group bacterium]|nr:hypothetical protein [Patescibacteria group bacterium]
MNTYTTDSNTHNKANFQSGQAVLIAVLFFLASSLIIVSGISSPVLRDIASINTMLKSKQSYFLAEGGVEEAVYRIKKGIQIDPLETIVYGGGTSVTIIADISNDEKRITATGDILSFLRNAEIELSTSVGIDFFYGSQAGDGGIIMEENSRIEGVGGQPGNIYSNGPVVGGNGATITGDATVATLVTESNQDRSLVCNQDKVAGQADPTIDFAQSFNASDSKPIAKISLYIKKVGSPASRSVHIVADNFGSPSSVSLFEGTLLSSLVGDEYSWIDVTFPTPAILTSGTTYWIVLDARKDQNRYWVWCSDSNNGYGDGVGKYSANWTDGSWTSIIGDLTFRVFFGEGINAIDNVDVTGTAKANTILNSTIGGDAYYQSLINTTVSGTSYPGSPDPSPINLPISQAIIDQWKKDAGCGEQPPVSPCLYSGDYIVTEDTTLGPLTITGDLDMTSVKKTLTITGVVYVKGNIDISNGSSVRCDTSFGDKSCVVLTDSWVHVSNNGVFQGSGQTGSHIMFLSTLACDGSSFSPPCDESHHNGAIDLHNNASGAIFYASDGLVVLHNGVSVTEVTGYKIQLKQNAVVTYEEGLINSSFSSGPGGSWNISSWKEVE